MSAEQPRPGKDVPTVRVTARPNAAEAVFGALRHLLWPRLSARLPEVYDVSEAKGPTSPTKAAQDTRFRYLRQVERVA